MRCPNCKPLMKKPATIIIMPNTTRPIPPATKPIGIYSAPECQVLIIDSSWQKSVYPYFTEAEPQLGPAPVLMFVTHASRVVPPANDQR